MICPQCKLENPQDAQRCDCGYDFISCKTEESYLSYKYGTKDVKIVLLIIGWFLAIIGGFMIALGTHLAYIFITFSVFISTYFIKAKDTNIPNRTLYNKKSIAKGYRLIIASIIILVLSNILSALRLMLINQ
jgi:hypothetical protein